MKCFCLAVVFSIFVFVPTVATQVTKPKVRPGASNTGKQQSRGYEFHLMMGTDGRVRMSVLTGFESEDLDNTTLAVILTDYVDLQSPKTGKRPPGPSIVIEAEPNLDLKTVVNVVRTARASRPDAVFVRIPNGPLLNVPAEPKSQQNIVVKPNPLLLVVAVTYENEITLNNEGFGKLTYPSRLIDKLREIFKQREDNGVLRSGSYEVEKTVFVKMTLSARFADLIQIASALQTAGADRIGLQIDDLPENVVNIRKDLIKVP